MSPKKIINANKHMNTCHGKHMKKLEKCELKPQKGIIIQALKWL